MQATSAQLWENILQWICINKLASRPTLFLHSWSSCFCSLSMIFSKSSIFCQAWSKRLAGLKASLRTNKKHEKMKAWCAGDLWKNMQSLKGVMEQDPCRVRGDREQVRPAPSLLVGLFKSTSPFCAFIVIHEQSASVGTPVLYKDNTI